MFPYHTNHKNILADNKKREQEKAIQLWLEERFRGNPAYIEYILEEFPKLKENFEPIKKYLDKVGFCEYCNYYIGTSPNARKFKNVGVLYGCCVKDALHFAIKYSDTCIYWKPKELWEDILFYKMEKIIVKLRSNSYQSEINKHIEKSSKVKNTT